MRIQLSSVLVEDQEAALAFYTEVLGFVKKTDLPAGEFRWVTVVSREGPEDVELVLEPNANPAARAYQKALFEQGIPFTAFAVDDIRKEYEPLREGASSSGPSRQRWGRSPSPSSRTPAATSFSAVRSSPRRAEKGSN